MSTYLIFILVHTCTYLLYLSLTNPISQPVIRILHLDSMGNYHNSDGYSLIVRNWLNDEWRSLNRGKIGKVTAPFSSRRMGIMKAKGKKVYMIPALQSMLQSMMFTNTIDNDQFQDRPTKQTAVFLSVGMRTTCS